MEIVSRCGGIVVKAWTTDSKIEGSNPATAQVQKKWVKNDWK